MKWRLSQCFVWKQLCVAALCSQQSWSACSLRGLWAAMWGSRPHPTLLQLGRAGTGPIPAATFSSPFLSPQKQHRKETSFTKTRKKPNVTNKLLPPSRGWGGVQGDELCGTAGAAEALPAAAGTDHYVLLFVPV